MSSVISKVRSSLSKRKKKHVPDNRLAEVLSNSSPDLNWQDILEEDVKYMTMLQIAGEITREKFGSRTSKHNFLAHCTYLAWVKIINLYFYALDPGEESVNQDPTWTSVPEPPPAGVDTLVGWSVPVLKDVVPVLVEPRQPLSHSSLWPRPSRLPILFDQLPRFSLEPPDEPEEESMEESTASLQKIDEASTSLKLSESSMFVKKMAQGALLDILNLHIIDKPKTAHRHRVLHHKMAQQAKTVTRQIEVKLNYVSPYLYPAPRVPVTYVVSPVDLEKEEKQPKHKTKK